MAVISLRKEGEEGFNSQTRGIWRTLASSRSRLRGGSVDMFLLDDELWLFVLEAEL